MFPKGHLSVSESSFENNRAGKLGAAILLGKNGKAEISKTKFSSNDSGSEGGAIYDDLNSYTDPADATQGYTNLITDETVSFENNSVAYLLILLRIIRIFHGFVFLPHNFRV